MGTSLPSLPPCSALREGGSAANITNTLSKSLGCLCQEVASVQMIADTSWAVPTTLDFAAGFALWSLGLGDLYSVKVKTQGFVTDTKSVRDKACGTKAR